MIITRELIRIILSQYSLDPSGVHGLGHWARVLENGMRLAPQTGADAAVVQLFAVLHDSQRTDEGTDRGHGRRAAHYIRRLRGRNFDLDRDQFELLTEACAGHTGGRTEADMTIQTCWDADRLDLGRVGIRVDPRLLCTAAARDPDLIEWATRRAVQEFRPEFLEDWA